MIQKVYKSKNKMAGEYVYRGVYISKSPFGGAKKWYARSAELGVDIPVGLSEKTRSRLCFSIDRALDNQ